MLLYAENYYLRNNSNNLKNCLSVLDTQRDLNSAIKMCKSELAYHSNYIKFSNQSLCKKIEPSENCHLQTRTSCALCVSSLGQ